MCETNYNITKKIIFQEQIMTLISELMGISFGQADIYRRALEKMHKPANKAKVDYFNENAVRLAVERGIPKEDAEYIKKMILDNCGYAFNKCLSGRTKIKRASNQYTNYTIEEMYKIKNDREYAKSINKLSLHKKYKNAGYGKGYSMQNDGRLRLNNIKDITYSGKKAVFKVTTEDGSFVECTMNHSFPTPNGVKLLFDLKIGDELYINAGYEKQKYEKLNKIRSNNYLEKGQRGFVKGEFSNDKCTIGIWKFDSYRNKCVEQNKKCELYGNDGKELHHIDGNHDNNTEENFQWLCISCHKKKHYACGRTKKDEKGLLTKLAKITSIEFVCVEDTYDVEMEDPYHNFATESGIIVKNSHAVCYSYISYYTAYMKVHYPLIFHKTMLNGNLDNLPEFIDMTRKDGVKINPPHVSYSDFTTEIEDEETKQLRIGFNTINGIGEKALNSIKLFQPYKNINEFFEKNNSQGTNKKVVEALIKSGSFDGLGIKVDTTLLNIKTVNDLGLTIINEDEILLNRKQLAEWHSHYIIESKVIKMPSYEVPADKIKNKYITKFNMQLEPNNTYTVPEVMLDLMEINKEDIKSTRRGPKGVLKQLVASQFKLADPFTRVFIKYLKDIISLSIADMEIYLNEIKENGFSFIIHPLNKFINGITDFKAAKDGDLCTEAGIITGLYAKKTKTGKTFYYLMLRTPREEVRITIWNNQYEKYKELIKLNNMVKVRGTKGYGSISCDIMAQVKSVK